MVLIQLPSHNSVIRVWYAVGDQIPPLSLPPETALPVPASYPN